MPFESSYDPATRILLHRGSGGVTAPEITQLARAWHGRLSDKRFRALWDLREAKLEISLEELLLEHGDQIDWLNRHRRGGRFCYLVSSALAAAMLRFLKERAIEVPGPGSWPRTPAEARGPVDSPAGRALGGERERPQESAGS